MILITNQSPPIQPKTPHTMLSFIITAIAIPCADALTNLHQAEQIIVQTEDNVFDLSGLELTSIDMNALNCSLFPHSEHNIHLDLVNNALTTVPNIPSTITVTELYLDLNPLIIDEHTVFPAQLESLHLCGATIKSINNLPSSLRELRMQECVNTATFLFSQSIHLRDSNIQSLVLSGNSIDQLDGRFLPFNLQRLDLSTTGIRHISHLPLSIKNLALDDNGLTSATLANVLSNIKHSSIETLTLTFNEGIRYLDGRLLPEKVQVLCLRGTRIQQVVHLNAVDQLTTLSAYNCGLTTDELSKWNMSESSLLTLQLSGNSLTSLAGVAFPRHLKTLMIEQNPLRHIGDVLFIPGSLQRIEIPNVINGKYVTVGHPIITELISKLGGVSCCIISTMMHDVCKVRHGRIYIKPNKDYQWAISGGYVMDSVTWITSPHKWGLMIFSHSSLVVEFKHPQLEHFITVKVDAWKNNQHPLQVTAHQYFGDKTVIPGANWTSANIWWQWNRTNDSGDVKYATFGHIMNFLVTKQMKYVLRRNNCHHVTSELVRLLTGITGSVVTIPDFKILQFAQIVSVGNIELNTNEPKRIIWTTYTQCPPQYSQQEFESAMEDYMVRLTQCKWFCH
eukprot:198023_1